MNFPELQVSCTDFGGGDAAERPRLHALQRMTSAVLTLSSPREVMLQSVRRPPLRANPTIPRKSACRAGFHLPLLFALLALIFWVSVASAEEPTGILKVSSSVPGARVYIDNEDVGTTPITRYVRIGSRQVRVVLDRYDPFVRRAEVSKDSTTKIDAILTPGRGTVEFALQVPGARLFIDEKDMGPTPIRLRDLKTGEHRWRVTAPRFEDASGTLQFQEGKNLLLSPALESSEGLFSVSSEPPGATILLDGKEVGTTPWKSRDIPKGPHNVRLLLSGWATQIHAIDTSDGSKGKIESRFMKDGLRLKVLTGNDTARVKVNGDLIGQGRKVVIDRLDRVGYKVRVEAPGFVSVDREIGVVDSGRLVLKAHLQPDSAASASTLQEMRPLVQRWTFWAATGGLAAGSVTGGIILASALKPEPAPEGDVIVVLP